MKKLIALLSSSILTGCSPTYENAAVSPAVIAAISAAILTAIVTNYIKNKEYKYEYYKKVIQNRVDAYKIIEKQVAILSALSIDKRDNATYMTVFRRVKTSNPTENTLPADPEAKFNNFELLREDIEKAIAQRLWISDKILTILGKLYDKYNIISIEYSIDDVDSLMRIGKKYYSTLLALRIELEDAMRSDYKDIHEIEKFFKAKSQPTPLGLSAKPHNY